MVFMELEKEFSRTCRLILGAELVGLKYYESWLGKKIPLPYSAKSVVSGKEVWVSPSLNYMGRKFSKEKIISFDEIDKINKSPFKYEDIENLNIKEIIEKIIKPVSYVTGNFRYKTYTNVEKCSGAGDGRNLYYGEDLFLSIKNTAYSNYVLYSKNMFGCHNAPYSEFCIHTYNSINAVRCFESEGCLKCTDLLFCHNCEGTNNSLFCFNAKNLRYAVGNTVVGKERYHEIKQIILDYIVKELRERKNLHLDIYNLSGEINE